jgi:phosphomevalonate decarboxylase
VEFDPNLKSDQYSINGKNLQGRSSERVKAVVDRVRELGNISHHVKLESTNSFPSNIGLGSSSSGFAAAALALSTAANLDLSLEEISTIARRGSSSAARSVTGGFSILRSSENDLECKSYSIDDGFNDDLRIIVAIVPAHKETESAHVEATKSHMFQARVKHAESQIFKALDAIEIGDFDGIFSLAELDSISLAATTMTGPKGWIYWKPETLSIFENIRILREGGADAYFSTDTGATVYINTREKYVAQISDSISDLEIETQTWHVGGPATILDRKEDLF